MLSPDIIADVLEAVLAGTASGVQTGPGMRIVLHVFALMNEMKEAYERLLEAL